MSNGIYVDIRSIDSPEAVAKAVEDALYFEVSIKYTTLGKLLYG